MTLDWKKVLKITNNSGGRVVEGSIVIPHGQSQIINPLRHSKEALKALEVMHERGMVLIENVEADTTEKSSVQDVTSKVETVKNEHGEKREHTVFDHKKAIVMTEIDVNDKAIKVESLNNESSAVEVGYTEADKIEARALLDSHWKKVESTIKNMNSKRKVQFYLEVAKEHGVADKKIEIIEAKLSEM